MPGADDLDQGNGALKQAEEGEQYDDQLQPLQGLHLQQVYSFLELCFLRKLLNLKAYAPNDQSKAKADEQRQPSADLQLHSNNNRYV